MLKTITKKRLAWAMAALTAGGALYGWFGQGSAPGSELPSLDTRGVHYAPGMVYRYDVEVASRSHARAINGAVFEGELHLRGALCIEGVEPRAESARAMVSICDVDRVQWEVMHQDVLAPLGEDSMLTSGGVVVDIAPDGTFSSPQWRKATTEQAQSLLHTLLPELMVEVEPQVDAWERNHPNSVGDGRILYQLNAEDGAHYHLTRGRPEYLAFVSDGFNPSEHQLSNRYEIEMSDRGHLVALEGGEDLIPAESAASSLKQESRFRLMLRHISPTSRTFVEEQRMELSSIGGHLVTKGTRQRLLESQAQGFTREQMNHDLALYAAGGTMPGGNRWLWQAEGLLKLNPSYAEDLVPLFLSEAMNHQGRKYIFDVLSSAGTPEAQAVMRSLVETETFRVDIANRVAMLQDFMFLKEPTDESLRFMIEQYRENQGEDAASLEAKRAMAYSLGGMAKSFAEYGLLDEAQSALQPLREDLTEAEDRIAQQVLVAALGNAGLEEDVETIVEFAQSDAPELRFTAAIALRHIPNDEAREALVELGKDVNGEVQRKAFQLLEDMDLTAKEFRSLCDGVSPVAMTKGGQLDYGKFLLGQMNPGRTSASSANNEVGKFLKAGLGDSKLRRQMRAALED